MTQEEALSILKLGVNVFLTGRANTSLDNNNARRYYPRMIVGFGDSATKAVFEGRRSKQLPSTIDRAAMRKLWMLDAAAEIADLRVPPGNRLEKLSGNWNVFHSIRINDQ